MTSRKDLLEAQAFTRRRLLAVLVAGAPGGLEPEPAAGTGRALLGGFVVAVLVALVVAVSELMG